MCGIAAIFRYADSAPPIYRDELRLIGEQMRSRGPDGAGEWISDNGRLGFAHRRLSIIDLSAAGLQPMFSRDAALAVVFNGEIYNYKELRQKLTREGRQLRSYSDTEVLLELYATRGAAMVNDLRGMYAFALWDKNKQGLLLARDPFGIKPLYYSDNGHTLRLASQVKALLAGGEIDHAPDPAGHVGFFIWGHVPEPYTLCRNVRSLPAGNTMWFDRTGSHPPKCFCNISQILAECETGSWVSNGAAEELLRSALEETVRYHLVADVPVGVFLSSGLDSTTIAALAAAQGGNLRTVTLGFDEYKGTDADETPLAEQFAQKCGGVHQTVWVSRSDFETERDHLFQAMDQPSTNGVNTFFVSLAAKRANLKVALSGVGGDELFGTYASFRDIPRIVMFSKPVSSVLPNFGREFRVISTPILKRLTSPKYAGMFELGDTYAGAYLLRRGMFMPWELPELLDPEVVRAGWRELQTLVRLDQTLNGIENPRLKVSALELSWYMRNQLLRDSDWAGMAHSIEIRVPFVDISFLRQVAPVLASARPPSKREVAAAASKLITSDLLDRRKTGFQIPVREWLLGGGDAEVPPSNAGDRGLRGWAKHVYRQFNSAPVRRTPHNLDRP